METNKKYTDAKNRIKEFGLYHAIGDLPHSSLTVDAFDCAITCIDKRIKMKPKKLSMFVADGSKKDIYLCSSCGDTMVGIDSDNGYHMKYCYNCGQAQEWENAEK